MYSTASLEDLEVTPEAEDEHHLVVPILGNGLTREL